MKILVDQGTPVPLRWHLTNHSIATTFERGWSGLTNGELLEIAEQEGYDVLITTDQNLRHQQNLSGRKLAILVFLSTSWPRIKLKINEIQRIVDGLVTGDYKELSI